MASTSTKVFITSLTGKLSIVARYIVSDVIRSQNNNVRGCISSLLVPSNFNRYVMCNDNDEAAMFATSIHDTGKPVNTTVFTSFGADISNDRSNITALRTALLQTMQLDDVTIYVEHGTTTYDLREHMVTPKQLLLWAPNSEQLQPIIDVIVECVNIIELRISLGKRLCIRPISSEGDECELKRIKGDSNTATTGYTDWVLYDDISYRNYTTSERLHCCAKQMGMDHDLRVLLS